MIIFAYLPYGLAEGIKLSGGSIQSHSHNEYMNIFVRLTFPLTSISHLFLSTYRNNVYPVCGNCDVSLHPSQPISCHPDPYAADTAHCGLYVWSVDSRLASQFTVCCHFIRRFHCFLNFFLQRRVCLRSSAFPSSASLINLKYHL